MIYNLGNKTVLYLICNRIDGFLECKTEQRNSQCEHGQPMEQTKGFFCTPDSLSITTVSLEFNFLSVLHGQLGLAAVNHIYVFHETMNACKNLKSH